MYNEGIEAFLAIVRFQSLSKAAEQLHLSQSAISHRLELLENEVGAPLVERRRGFRKIALTAAGDQFLHLAEEWQRLEDEMRSFQSKGPRLSLNIGAVDSVNAYLLGHLYRMLHQSTPKISLRVRTQQTLELYELVENMEVDIGFALQDRYVPNVVVTPFLEEKMVLAHLIETLNDAVAISPADLDPSRELFIDWGPAFRLWHDHWWDPRHFSGYQIDTAQLLIATAVPGDWAVVPVSMGNFLEEMYGFGIVELSDMPPNRTVYKLTHRLPSPSTKESLQLFDEVTARWRSQTQEHSA
ncbi:MAG: LysR family transcriptional regulator [Firmicutes bacterium]|nr:LysR family transcriptional regulator [Bacillota bacterium]